VRQQLRQRRLHDHPLNTGYTGGVEALAVVFAFGLPVAAGLVMVGFVADRLLRAGERRGWVLHSRNWVGAGVGNALLELHVALEPDRVRIETRLMAQDEDEGIGDGRGEAPAGNVIVIDFSRRRRLG
jgi:hypothetical protein